MVFENFLSAKLAEKQSWILFVAGFFYAVLGALISYLFFPADASIVMVFLTVLGSAYIMHSIIELEEEVDESKNEVKSLYHHSLALKAFFALFLGFTVAYTLMYGFLDYNIVSKVFESQTNTLYAINGRVTSIDAFNVIVSNNLKVLFVSLLFGFMYGYGALFILAWNASVIGAAAGNYFRAAISDGGGFFIILYHFLNSLGQYALHGIPEIAAYFIGALAASILGVSISKKVWKDQVKFINVISDVIILTVLAVILVFISAGIEVYITPLL